MTPFQEEIEMMEKLAVDKVGEDHASDFMVGYLKTWVLGLERTIAKFHNQVVEEVERYNPYKADEWQEGFRL